MLDALFTSDVLYHAARECAIEAVEEGADAYTAALKLITEVSGNSNLPMTSGEVVSLAEKASQGVQAELLDLAS
ncbi:hypothetical protein [Carnimonas bestiolae]|uniref:hypothetical protein n=1 Tax=Carnimonas bestiolae TaxID=3402172 RepID=UPI003EDC85CA